MSVLEIVLYSVISLLVGLYVIKTIREIIKGKKKKDENQPKNEDEED